MKKEFVDTVYCLKCGKDELVVSEAVEDMREIRSGVVLCSACNARYEINDGILNLLVDLCDDAVLERKTCNERAYLEIDDTEKYTITHDTIRRFKDIFLSFPLGNGHPVFGNAGCFQNQSENAQRFFKTLDDLQLKPGMKVLEIGASFGWAAREFVKRGCEVTALDVNDYMITADLYFEENGVFFNRVLADMNNLPFKDNQFDLVFSNTALHHSESLKAMYGEIFRVLKKRGKLVALGECSLGLFEDPNNPALQVWRDAGHQEHAYRIHEWIGEAKKAGASKARAYFFSPIADYINKKELRGAKKTVKLKLAYWIHSVPFIEHCIQVLSSIPRRIFRPGSWRLECVK